MRQKINQLIKKNSQLQKNLIMAHRVYLVIILSLLCVISFQFLNDNKSVTIVGTGSLEKIDDNVFKVTDDEPVYELTELPSHLQ